jgi:small subunit ribosomal protein S6
MVRPYEVVYIFDAALEDETIAQKLEQYHTLVGAVEATLNHWGRRTLAYPIKRRTTGYYAVANFGADTGRLPEFERALKLDESLLRFLVVLNDTPATPAQAIPPKPGDDEEDE